MTFVTYLLTISDSVLSRELRSQMETIVSISGLKLVSISAVQPSLASRGLAPGKVCLRLVPPPAARPSEWAELRGSGDGVEHSAVVLVVVVTSLGVLVIVAVAVPAPRQDARGGWGWGCVEGARARRKPKGGTGQAIDAG